jgi:type II secretory pathway pseudopilin PulG
MTWGAIAVGVGGAVIGSMSDRGGSQTNGGAGTQTVNRDPWAAAQPWLTSNLASGQTLQNNYAAQPFSGLQNQAYQNQSNQSAYMRAAVPSLLGQIQGQQVGFDRNNPNARPNAFSFDGLMSAANAGQQAAQAQQAQQAAQAQQAQQSQGLLGMLTSGPSAAPLNLAANTPAAAAPPPAPAAAPSQFVQQSTTNDPNIASFMAALGQKQTNGSYGTFKYGDMPVPGTQQYYDMKQYLAYGGNDPKNLYGGGSMGLGNLGGNAGAASPSGAPGTSADGTY